MRISVGRPNIKRPNIKKPEPPVLGLMLCELYFALYLVAALIYAALCPPHLFAYDLSLLRAVLIASSSAVTLYLLHKRRKNAWICALVTVVVCVVLSAIDLLGLGAINNVAEIVGLPIATGITALEYFGAGFVSYALIIDVDVRAQLVTTASHGPAYNGGHSWDTPLRERVRTWEFWRDLIIYFIVFSFLGHWAEILFCRLIIAGVFMGGYDPTNAMLWDQWLFPFSAEGTALAAVVVILHPAKEWLLRKFNGNVPKALAASFLLNGLICTSIDFGTGMVANQNYELWDYRDMPFNFMGQVCLQNSLVYTVAATLIVWVVYPLMDSGLRSLSKDTANGLFWALVGAYGFLALLHFIDPSMAVA